MKKSILSLGLCLTLIFCSLSMSSFASFLPFVPAVKQKETSSEAESSETAWIVSETTMLPELPAAESLPAAITEAPEEPETTEAPETTDDLPGDDTASTEKEENAAEKTSTEEYTAAAKTFAPAACTAEADGELNTDIKGSLLTAEAGNSYTFTVSERGVLQFSFTRDKSNAVWKVALYQQVNANGYDGEVQWRLLHQTETDIAKSCDISPNIGLQKGVYRIVVTAGSTFSAAGYTLKASFTPGTEYEIEYNDSLYHYTEICPGVPVRGSAAYLPDANDKDYFMFRVYDNARVNISLAHTAIDGISVLWRVSLFDVNGKELYADNAASAQALLSSGDIGLAPGAYFICVESRVYTDFDYTLTVTRKADGAYETEPNGTFAAADMLPLNGRIAGALTSSAGANDTDVFALKLLSAGTVKLTFTAPAGTEEDNTHRIRFTDASGRGLWEDVVSPVNNSAVSALIGLAAGTYYVSIDNNGLHKNSGEYTAAAAFTAASGWESEYNGSIAAADTVAAGSAVTGTIVDCEAEFDDDYFTFTLSSPAIIRLSLRHEARADNKHIFTVSLLDKSGNAVQVEDAERHKLVTERGEKQLNIKSFGDTESVQGYYTLAAGTYYIRVTSGLFSPDMKYELLYSVKTGG